MDPATIERLKQEWTGRRVVASGSNATLSRFAGRTGLVKTVNMNGRALVQFEGTVDISWYDLELDDLQIVAAPVPTGQATPVSSSPGPAPGASAKSAPAATPAAAPVETDRPLSKLELARRQGAAKRP